MMKFFKHIQTKAKFICIANIYGNSKKLNYFDEAYAYSAIFKTKYGREFQFLSSDEKFNWIIFCTRKNSNCGSIYFAYHSEKKLIIKSSILFYKIKIQPRVKTI